MALIKTKEDIINLKVAGKRLAIVLKEVSSMVEPGITTAELNKRAHDLIIEKGDKPAFLNYQPEGSPRPYPATLCVSVNDEIVHGLPGDRILKEGDIVGLDLGLIYNGLFVDSAVTVPVGRITEESQKIINITKEALMAGIKAARGGAFLGDIGYAIEQFAKLNNYGLVQELGGHGVGHKVHEDPYIPNFGKKGTGLKLQPGMVLALEPMFNLGTEKIFLNDDGFTFKTADQKISAHFEHTILITEKEPEILTSL